MNIFFGKRINRCFTLNTYDISITNEARYIMQLEHIKELSLNDKTWEGGKILGIISFSFEAKLSSMHKFSTERFTTSTLFVN